MITHGKISRLLMYLAGLRQGHFSRMNEFRQLSHCTVDEAAWVESMCESCKLVRLSNNAEDVLSSEGCRLADLHVGGEVCMACREVLSRYIESQRPIWANRMPMGREETYAVISNDEYYCFKQAGLTGYPPADDVVEWWDGVASAFRPHDAGAKLEIGRKGERMTIAFESRRTGRLPRWQSIESNFAGYDILSSESATDSALRLIEVKSSDRPLSTAIFHISNNEWETAMLSSDRYYFYLWLVGGTPELAIVPSKEMRRHVSVNVGDGVWESIRVPFSSFRTFFKKWTV